LGKAEWIEGDKLHLEKQIF